MTTSNCLRDILNGPEGFTADFGLQPDEYNRVKQLIESQWLDRIRQCAPDVADRFSAVGIGCYHHLQDLVDHRSLWPKAARILPPGAVEQIRQMSLLQLLETEFGEFTITDEEELQCENIYWRIVRPNEPSDVGPLHADSWYWDLGHGNIPSGFERVKVWIAVVCEPSRNGLQVVPGSHLRNYRYHSEQRDGIVKPRIDEDVAALHPRPLATSPGAAVIFHDRLLHGGVVNRGSLTRISLEFTMFVRDIERHSGLRKISGTV